MNLRTWAAEWGIPMDALLDLERRIGLEQPPAARAAPRSEAWVQSAVRLEAAQKGVLLFRNNSGAFRDDTGRLVRFGLANDSKALNAELKSSDLIGIRKRLITQQDVGTVIGQFTCRENKPEDWQYTGTEREEAQLAFIMLILSHGGDAGFATAPDTL